MNDRLKKAVQMIIDQRHAENKAKEILQPQNDIELIYEHGALYYVHSYGKWEIAYCANYDGQYTWYVAGPYTDGFCTEEFDKIGPKVKIPDNL